uniref:Thaumarchaeal output domain-containing protein n=1 Tax=Fervidicoccus fontis TaxID=683846 RepID=A0A7J3ZKS4_9CREN
MGDTLSTKDRDLTGRVLEPVHKQRSGARGGSAPANIDGRGSTKRVETKSESVRKIVREFGWRLVGELALALYRHALLEDENSIAIHEELDDTSGEIVVHGDPAYLPPWLQKELNEKISEKIEVEDLDSEESKAPAKLKHELLLKELVDIGLLSRREISRILTCPKCSSPRLKLRLYCPNCGSDAVKSTRLIQHIVCGFTDTEDRLEKVGDELRCPLCKAIIVDFETQTRVLGRTFYCEGCGLTFKQPNIRIRCTNRETLKHEPNYEFDLLSTSVRKLWGYRLAPGKESNPLEVAMILEESIREFSAESKIPLEVYSGRGTLGIEKLPKELKSAGFTVIIESVDGKIVLVDLASGKEPLQYVMKASLLEGKEDINYILLTTPATEAEEYWSKTGVGAGSLEGNIEIIRIVEGGSFGRLIRRIQKVFSGGQG